MSRQSSVVAICVAASLALLACGRGDPSAPSDAVALAAASAANGSAGTSGAGITGTISALSGACPALTFTLERKTIRTSAATSYGDARCTDVKNAIRVEVVGATQADGSVVAATVRLPAAATTPTPTPTPTAVPAISGNITAVSGTCPALTITVERKTATTSSATFFDGKGCGDLRVGTMVNIFGSIPAGGTVVVATKVAAPR